jgi:hypothetical protein
VDTSGHPYVCAVLTNATAPTTVKPQVWQSYWTNGSWSTTEGYPITLNSTTYDASYRFRVIVLALTNDRVYAIWSSQKTKASGRLYNGTAWLSEERISNTNPKSSVNTCATCANDDVFFVFANSSQIVYRRRVHGSGWQNEEIVHAGILVGSLSPVIAVSHLTGDAFVFWINWTTAHMFYRVRNSTMWGNEVDWLNEAKYNFTSNYRFTCTLESGAGKLGVAYCVRSERSSLYTLKWASIQTTQGTNHV